MDYDVISAALKSQIGRVVAFVLTPVLLPIVGAVSVWAQDAVGINLDPTAVVAYVVAVVGGCALVAFKWLENRGRFELVAVEAQKLHDAGLIR